MDTFKFAALTASLFAGALGARAAPVALDEVPPPARATIEREAKGRPLKSLDEQPTPEGDLYSATFHKLTEGTVQVTTDAAGVVLDRPNRLDQPTGDGP